jgi:two-component system, LytTR family, sensor kinase
MSPAGRRRAVAAGVILSGWTLLALLFAPQTYLANLQAPRPLTWTEAFIANAALFYMWAVLTPLVLWLGRQFPIDRGRIPARVAVHFAAALAVTVLHLVGVSQLNMLLMGNPEEYRPPVPAVALVVGYGATDVMIYWGLLAAGHALVYFRRYQDREFRLVQAQLHSLRTQLHPHFLFNTLNAIAELIYQDPPSAERTVTQLSDLLRQALNRGDEHEIQIGEEMDFLQKYVAIQQTLLQERLTVHWNVAPETTNALVPAMILQPVVENAVQHGIAPRASGGTLYLSTRREGEMLRLQVQDDGVGLRDTRMTNDGVGLSNTRARLQHLYGEHHTWEMTATPGGGVTVTMRVPFREARGEV